MAPAARAGLIEELEQQPEATGRRSTTSSSLELAPAASRMESSKSRIAYLDNLNIVPCRGRHRRPRRQLLRRRHRVARGERHDRRVVVCVGRDARDGVCDWNHVRDGDFFFVAGGLTPGSIARRGEGRYLRGRLVRLGAPLVASILLILPASWFLGVLGTTGNVGQAWKAAVGSLLILDPGVAWFLTELLIFSAACVVYRRWRPRPARAPESLRIRHVLTAIWLIAAVTFGVRLVWPMNSYQRSDCTCGCGRSA